MYPFTQLAFVENLLCASIVLDPGDPNRKDTTLDLERSQFWEEAWRDERLDNRGWKDKEVLDSARRGILKASQERHLDFQGKIKVSHRK